jgi:hypothetical protein
VTETVRAAGREAEANGTLGTGPGPDPRTMFEGIFKEMAPHVAEQRAEAGL